MLAPDEELYITSFNIKSCGKCEIIIMIIIIMIMIMIMIMIIIIIIIIIIISWAGGALQPWVATLLVMMSR